MPDLDKPVLVFDVGNVLLYIDNDRMLRNVSALLKTPPDAQELLRQIRSSKIGTGQPVRELWGELSAAYGSDSSYDDFLSAWSSHFEPNDELIALLPTLAEKWRLAICSNTNDGHWSHIEREYALHNLFDDVVLSHHCGIQKPDCAIYEHTLERIGVRKASAVRPLFFDDDESNVAGAIAAGLDAHVFRSTAELRGQLGV